MTKTIARALVAVALLAAPRALAAQQTAEQVAERYFAATKAGQWGAAATLMHPRALESFKAMLTEIASFDETGEAVAQIFGVSAAEMQRLSGAQVYERVIGRLMGQQPMMAQVMGNATFRVVGHVPEGDTAHVVYRLSTKVMGASVSQISVLSLARQGGEWRALLTGDVEAMFAGMRGALRQAEAEEPARTPRTPPRPR